MSAGPIAVQLRDLYDFVLLRLEKGNLAKDPRPTEEALQVLRGLLEAWQDLAARPAYALVDEPVEPVRSRRPVSSPEYAGAGAYSVSGSRR
jgi:hypothetical protein